MNKIKALLQYFLAFIIIATAAIILMDQIVMPLYVKHGQQVNLPDVRGMQYEKAEQLLRKDHFVPIKGEMKYNAEYEPGQIIEQQPRANSKVKTGRRVYLTIAMPEKFIEMPALVGKTVRGAKIELSRVGLKLDSLTYGYSSQFPQGVIIWQSVKEKGMIRRGSTVQLRVSKGKNPNIFKVPDLSGLSLDEAKSKIKNAGLEVGKIQYVQDQDLIPYTTLQQSVPAGSTLTEPQKIDLVVSVDNLKDIFNNQTRDQ